MTFNGRVYTIHDLFPLQPVGGLDKVHWCIDMIFIILIKELGRVPGIYEVFQIRLVKSMAGI